MIKYKLYSRLNIYGKEIFYIKADNLVDIIADVHYTLKYSIIKDYLKEDKLDLKRSTKIDINLYRPVTYYRINLLYKELKEELNNQRSKGISVFVELEMLIKDLQLMMIVWDD